MLKLADINAQLHNVLYLTLNTPIREKRIAGFPTSQGFQMSNRQGLTISQFQNNIDYSRFLSSMEPVFNQSCHYRPVLRPPSARSLKFEKEY